MPFPVKRITIRSLMIAIAVIAGLLALPEPWPITAVAFSFPCMSLRYASWLHAHGQLRMARICFWTTAILINGAYSACSVVPGIHLVLLCMAWFPIVLPTLAGFGIAWGRLASRGVGERRQSTLCLALAVFALTVMPLVTALTAWPSQLTFLMARPALESLADRVAAGQPVTSPRWVGPYRIAASAFDPASGNVGLMTDTRPGGPCGFVRDRRPRSGPHSCHRPIRGDWYHFAFVGGWCYHEED